MKYNKYLDQIYKKAEEDDNHSLPSLKLDKPQKLKAMKPKKFKMDPINSTTSSKSGLSPTGIRTEHSYKRTDATNDLHIHTPKILKKI